MLEGMRSSLVVRLVALIGRFDHIDARALRWQDDFDLAQRSGLGLNSSLPTVMEISTKANEQADLCSEAMDLLLDKKAFPLMFKRGVSRAERFAGQCEAALDILDRGAEAGRAAFRSRIGENISPANPVDPNAISSERMAKLANLAAQLAEADAAMSLQLKMQKFKANETGNNAPNP